MCYTEICTANRPVSSGRTVYSRPAKPGERQKIGSGSRAAAPMMVDTINVDLDRPFIYVIYDPNDLPIYIGNVNDL